jgi:peptidoglycan/LPS O-acetylase OafA/YrhL
MVVMLGSFVSFGWKSKMAEISVTFAVIPLLIIGTIKSTGIRRTVLDCGPLRFFGRISYSVYLYQQLFIVPKLSDIWWMATLQRFPINLIFVMVAALLSYYLVEQPMIRLGRTLMSRLRTTRSKWQNAASLQG